MKPYYEDDNVTLHAGDCIDVLKTLADNSVDAVVTDPPYDLTQSGGHNPNSPAGRSRISTGGFMGKTWDATGIAFDPEVWRLCLRVLKPGGHMLAFGGTRTWHRLACAVEDAGFEIRDSIAWLYGSGFPKSLDVSKAIDKAAGAEREVVGTERSPFRMADPLMGNVYESTQSGDTRKVDADGYIIRETTAPATDAAKQWQGWGTALKPSHEPCLVATKPYGLDGILDSIGSQLDRLESECNTPAKPAADSSLSKHPEHAAETSDSAHASAETDTSPGESEATATSNSQATESTCLSIVASWKRCLAELCDITSTYTTATNASLTTDLRTLNSCLAQITPASITRDETNQPGSMSLVTAADNLFASVVCGSRATLALSAIETATGATPTRHQDAAARPAFEPVVVARKPLSGTVAQTVQAWGTGALNIDGCRVGAEEVTTHSRGKSTSFPKRPGETTVEESGRTQRQDIFDTAERTGRWPANVVLDGGMADELDKQSGTSTSRAAERGELVDMRGNPITGTGGYQNAGGKRIAGTNSVRGHDDSGGASRFFPTFRYTAKAPGTERPSYKQEGSERASYAQPRCTKCGKQPKNVTATAMCQCAAPDFQTDPAKAGVVSHPTVKPLELMRWLVRLVTPPGGVVLDPFAGSGTTGEAAIHEHKRAILIEREPSYLPLIVARLSKPMAVGFDFEVGA